MAETEARARGCASGMAERERGDGDARTAGAGEAGWRGNSGALGLLQNRGATEW